MTEKRSQKIWSSGVPWKARHTPFGGNDDIWCIDWSVDQEEVAEFVHGEANAKLMAASPKMFKVCRAVLEYDCPWPRGSVGEVVEIERLKELAREAMDEM